MENRERQIDTFFNFYCDIFNKAVKSEIPGIERTAELFSPCFIAANPSGVHCGQNDETFRDAMKNGYAFYRDIGITSMDIVSKDITLLDNLHAMTKVHWKSNFIKKDGLQVSIEFENIYLTQSKGSQHRVFAYITGDEQAALKDAGLI